MNNSEPITNPISAPAANPGSLAEPTPTNPNLSRSVDADHSIAQAYQAAADFMKQLELEE